MSRAALDLFSEYAVGGGSRRASTFTRDLDCSSETSTCILARAAGGLPERFERSRKVYSEDGE